MTTKTTKRKKDRRAPAVRQASIPDDLSYMTDTEFGREMLRLAAEIVEEQGTRTTEEINELVDLMRGGASVNADLS
jgi:hypothetical protein